jgi:hypothetical protein
MNTPTFLDLIDRLTYSAGSYKITTRNGTETKHLPSMLEELRAEVFLGMEGVGGSSSFGSRPPIDAGALDLLNEITTQATEALAAVTHAPPGLAHAEEYIRQWAGQTTDSQRVMVTSKSTVDDPATHAGQQAPFRPVVFGERIELTALQLAQQWCARIDDYFNPPSAREIPFPCPNCSERYHHRMRDGQHIRSCALNFIRDRQTGNIIEARCSACATTWAPDMFERLAVLLGGKTYEQVQAEWAEKDAAEAAKAAKRQKNAA